MKKDQYPTREPLAGEERVRELLGKTAADFETPEQVAARMAREDFAPRTVLPDNNTGSNQ